PETGGKGGQDTPATALGQPGTAAADGRRSRTANSFEEKQLSTEITSSPLATCPPEVWSMKVGCGFVEKEIRGNRYLYFWSFQGHGARVKKIERYMGPALVPDAQQRPTQA